jgi:endo-1,4-beta-xylanase
MASLPVVASLPAHAANPLPLWAAAQKAGILFGASAGREIFSDPAYGALQAEHSRLLVTDVATKFDYIRPREGVFEFEQADVLLEFARANGMHFRGAAMFWNDWPPPWLKGKSAAELQRIFDEHIEVVGARYNGAVHSWDVVNEPIWPDSRKTGGLRPGPWYDAMGEDYIFRAFKRLSQIDHSAKLVLNEAFCEHDDDLGRGFRKRMLPLIDKMLDKGLKLDVIGIESHIRPTVAFDIDVFLRFLDDIRARKLDIYLTEFDIEDVGMPKEIAKRDEEVALWTRRYLDPVLQNPAVKVLITWQLSDRYTWYRDATVAAERKFRFPARPLPFDEHFNEKSMGTAIRAALDRAPPRAQ